jgi:hypothetical protein
LKMRTKSDISHEIMKAVAEGCVVLWRVKPWMCLPSSRARLTMYCIKILKAEQIHIESLNRHNNKIIDKINREIILS